MDFIYIINLVETTFYFMTSYFELEKRIETLEKDFNCKNLENKIRLLEKEIKHLKAALQYQLRIKRN